MNSENIIELPTKPSIIIRIARILGIAFAIFISIFALDVFKEGQPFWAILTGLLIHLIPTFIILIVLWIAWKWPLPGGILFILVGSSYIVSANQENFVTYLLIAGPPIATGVLFLIGHFLKKQKAI